MEQAKNGLHHQLPIQQRVFRLLLHDHQQNGLEVTRVGSGDQAGDKNGLHHQLCGHTGLTNSLHLISLHLISLHFISLHFTSPHFMEGHHHTNVELFNPSLLCEHTKHDAKKMKMTDELFSWIIIIIIITIIIKTITIIIVLFF